MVPMKPLICDELADYTYKNLDLLVEDIESHDGEELEVGWPVFRISTYFLVDTPEVMCELLLTDGFPVDPDALVGRDEVG